MKKLGYTISLFAIVALVAVAGSASATTTSGNSSWAVVSFDQAQSGVRIGTTPYTATQLSNVVTSTQQGNNAIAQSAVGGNQSMTLSNGPFAQVTSGNVGSSLTWNTVSGCGNPQPCSGGTGLSNVSADTIGTVSQAQNTDDPTANQSETASIAQFSKVGTNQSATTGTITQTSNQVVVPPATTVRRDPAQSQTITGRTHSEGIIFIPVTSIITDINHFIQTITVTAENILSF